MPELRATVAVWIHPDRHREAQLTDHASLLVTNAHALIRASSRWVCDVFYAAATNRCKKHQTSQQPKDNQRAGAIFSNDRTPIRWGKLRGLQTSPGHDRR